MFRAGLQNGQLPEGIKSPVAHGRLPANQGRTLFEIGCFIHDALPGAGDNLRIAGRQISAGDLQIDGGLIPGLILGVKHPQRLRLVLGAKAGLFAGGRVLAIEHFPAEK